MNRIPLSLLDHIIFLYWRESRRRLRFALRGLMKEEANQHSCHLSTPCIVNHVLATHCYRSNSTPSIVQSYSLWLLGWLSEFLWHKIQKGHAAPDKSLKGRNDEEKKKGKEEYLHRDKTHTYKYKRTGWGLPSRSS